ncbi:unnamed protein product [Rhizophagus irregularis]|nr:unnamed protein product [Rhizophagus irregularis]CAB5373577.1 unnamed protein product [Rhizophagus irregularis]
MEEIFLKQLNILRKKRSQDTESPFPDISRDSLRKKTQRAVKIYKLVERRIIDHFTEKPNLDFTDDHDDSTDSKEVSESIIKTADYDDDPFKILEDEEDPFIAIRELNNTSSFAIVWNRFLTEGKGQNETTSNEATPAKVADCGEAAFNNILIEKKKSE